MLCAVCTTCVQSLQTTDAHARCPCWVHVSRGCGPLAPRSTPLLWISMAVVCAVCVIFATRCCSWAGVFPTNCLLSWLMLHVWPCNLGQWLVWSDSGRCCTCGMVCILCCAAWLLLFAECYGHATGQDHHVCMFDACLAVLLHGSECT